MSAQNIRFPAFNLDDPRYPLDKLVRELERLEVTDDRECAADHSVNAAVTAWHLADWTWVAIEQTPETLRKIADDYDLAAKPATLKDWKNFVRSDAAGGNSVRVCRVIANAFKHGTSDLILDREGIPDDPRKLERAGSPAPSTKWKFKIEGQVKTARFVFEEAHAFWNGLIVNYRIGDSGVGRLHPDLV